MTGVEIARELISVLSVTLSVESHRLLRDRASVNNAAMDDVTVMYPKLLDIGCLSLLLNLVGKRFKTPTLNCSLPSGFLCLLIVPSSKLFRGKQQVELHVCLRTANSVVGLMASDEPSTSTVWRY